MFSCSVMGGCFWLFICKELNTIVVRWKNIIGRFINFVLNESSGFVLFVLPFISSNYRVR